MKHLQDIIQESILDDNIEDKNIIPMIFKSIMNAKSFKEFKNVALSLKSYLDDEIGSDYKKASNKIDQNRSGQYLAVVDLGTPANKEMCQILVSSGPSTTHYLRFYKSTGRVTVMRTNMSFYDLIVAEDVYVYVLDDKWNELRKMIINKR